MCTQEGRIYFIYEFITTYPDDVDLVFKQNIYFLSFTQINGLLRAPIVIIAFKRDILDTRASTNRRITNFVFCPSSETPSHSNAHL